MSDTITAKELIVMMARAPEETWVAFPASPYSQAEIDATAAQFGWKLDQWLYRRIKGTQDQIVISDGRIAYLQDGDYVRGGGATELEQRVALVEQLNGREAAR